MHPKPREVKFAAKRNGILNEVFQNGGLLRFDLARRLNINATMVGNYVTELMGDEILIEKESLTTSRGRAQLGINSELGCFLGIDFEALRARAVLCDFAGDVIEQREVSFTTGISRENVLKTIISLAKKLADKADAPLVTIGIAAPGQVDCEAGRVLHYQLLDDFDQVPIRDRFEEQFDVPIFVEDNIRAVAYAELMRGSGQRSKNFICLSVRSGVGLGIIIDGKLYTGENALAGEVGYMVFPTSDGPKTSTDLVSAKGFVDTTVKLLESGKKSALSQKILKNKENISLQDIVKAAEEGDRFLQTQLDQLGTHLGMIAANLANLFAPEKVVLTGEVPVCSQQVRQKMERSFREFTVPEILNSAYLEDGTLGGYAGALGVAWLGFSRVFPVDEQTLIQLSKENALKTNLLEMPIGGVK